MIIYEILAFVARQKLIFFYVKRARVTEYNSVTLAPLSRYRIPIYPTTSFFFFTSYTIQVPS